MTVPYAPVRFARRNYSRNPNAADNTGTLVLRADELVYDERQPGSPAVLDADGEMLPEIVAFWGTSLCSGDKVFMRLSTRDEERALASNRDIPSNRRSLDTLCRQTGLPERPFAMSAIPEHERPIFRCDRARPILAADGRPLVRTLAAQADGRRIACPEMSCTWMTMYAPWINRAGERVLPADHMECQRFSTVNVGLFGPKQLARQDYAGLFREAVEDMARRDVTSYARACHEASSRIVQAWRQARAECPDESFGIVTVTTWFPEEGFRHALDDPRAITTLANFLAHPSFGPNVRTNAQGEVFTSASAVSADCILRFLNPDGEVCGTFRIEPRQFAGIARQARELGLEGTDEFWESPMGKAEFVYQEMVAGLDADYVAEQNIAAVDVLPGRCHRLSLPLLQPESGHEKTVSMNYATMQRLLFQGLCQSRSPFGTERINLGCAQAFVPRTPQDYVQGYHMLRDGAPYHNACLLQADGARLKPSPDYARAVEVERDALNNIARTLAAREADQATRAAMTEEPVESDASGEDMYLQDMPRNPRPDLQPGLRQDYEDEEAGPFPR